MKPRLGVPAVLGLTGSVLAGCGVLAGCAGTAEPEAVPSLATASPTATLSPTMPPATTPTPTTPAPPVPDPSMDQPLIDAAAAGDVAAVRDLLARGASVAATDATGRTALVAAAYGNHVEAAEVLVAAGADVMHQDSTLQSAFLIATSEVGDDPRLLDLTLAAGADVRQRDRFDGTALIRAAERGYPVVVARLLAAGVELDHVNNLGWTALHEAVVLGDGGPNHVETVRLIVAAGADTSIRGRDGRTPLQQARVRGYGDLVAVLEPATP